jgi:hypothetical protein
LNFILSDSGKTVRIKERVTYFKKADSMRFFYTILIILLPFIVLSQIRDSISIVTSKQPPKTIAGNNQNVNTNPAQYKPEIFTSGFIDIINNGQVNASSRFVRLFLGEPGKFAIPLSLYSGVSSNNFQNPQTSLQRNNDVLVTNFINPLSGLANISIDGVAFFKPKSVKLTKAGLLYHFGERILTGVKTGPVNDPTTGRPVNFLNTFAAFGLYIQTGAWEKNNNRNIGISWFALRYIGCYSNPTQLKDFLPGVETNGIYLGYSAAWGVEITKLVNIRVVYYRYTKKPEINYFLPIYQFSFNYSLK